MSLDIERNMAARRAAAESKFNRDLVRWMRSKRFQQLQDA